ncbi:11857_t:CDS:2, partial [Funneliformis mosseae]
QAHAKEYPIVSRIVQDHFIIQSISVALEQAFSVAGNTISKTCNYLLPEIACSYLCLKSWIVNEFLELVLIEPESVLEPVLKNPVQFELINRTGSTEPEPSLTEPTHYYSPFPSIND